MDAADAGGKGGKESRAVSEEGGGWVSGNPAQFYKQAAYPASRGMVASLPITAPDGAAAWGVNIQTSDRKTEPTMKRILPLRFGKFVARRIGIVEP